jgi:hypothetical protein
VAGRYTLVPEKPNQSSPHPVKAAASEPAAPFPERCLGTLQAILEHLKNLALTPAPAPTPSAPPETLPPVVAEVGPTRGATGRRPASANLNLEMVRTVRAQLAVLERRLDGLQLLVLINEWPLVQRLWWDLAFDMKMPLLQLNFLRELSRPRLDDLRLEGQSVADVLDRVGLLYSEVEFILIQRTDLIELSNVLEYRFAPELKKLRRFLEIIDAVPTA